MFEKMCLKMKNHSFEFVFVLLMIGMVFFIRCSEKDWKSILKEENAYIHDSFVETCNGRGFASLDEWQSVCREKFDLDYIAWCPAADFIVLDTSVQKGPLYYGKWHGKNGYGEVYATMLQ
ncbi:MAG: hypothetical protein K5829_14415 [Treponema sp.]|nr:hypothetical protein [Treponema sp.]